MSGLLGPGWGGAGGSGLICVPSKVLRKTEDGEGAAALRSHAAMSATSEKGAIAGGATAVAVEDSACNMFGADQIIYVRRACLPHRL